MVNTQDCGSCNLGSTPSFTPQNYIKEIVLSDSLHQGYRYFLDSSHPLYTSNGRIYLHRHVASVKLGRWLRSDEHVHHIDENKLNNNPSNLEVLTLAEHVWRHNEKRVPKDCIVCGKSFKPDNNLLSKFCSVPCSARAQVKDTTITKELLDSLIPTTSWVALGKMFGYSDTGIRKRAKALGCTITPRKYSKAS